MEDKEILALAASVIQQENAAVAGLVNQLPANFPQAVRALLECRGHVIVSGSGTSHAVALRFAHLLSCVGTPAFFLHPVDFVRHSYDTSLPLVKRAVLTYGLRSPMRSLELLMKHLSFTALDECLAELSAS